MADTITGKPSSLHCGPEIQQMKLNNTWTKQVKNPNLQEADQLAIYVQVAPRTWTTDYLAQIQLVVRVALELGITRFQVQRPNHLATLPPGTFFIFHQWWLFISFKI